MKPVATEQDIHLAVVEHLRWRGVPDLFAFHYPAGGYRRPVEAALLKAMGVEAQAGVGWWPSPVE
jgi:hypothetical protein